MENFKNIESWPCRCDVIALIYSCGWRGPLLLVISSAWDSYSRDLDDLLFEISEMDYLRSMSKDHT